MARNDDAAFETQTLTKDALELVDRLGITEGREAVKQQDLGFTHVLIVGKGARTPNRWLTIRH